MDDKKLSKFIRQASSLLCTIGLMLVVVFASGCSTLGKITLLSSPPQADVYVAALGEKKSKLVGQTPLHMTSLELTKAYGGSGPVYVEFKKEGFTSVKTLVTDIGAVDLTLNMELVPSSGLEDQVHLNAVVDSIFESQRLAKVGREEDALARLKSLEKDAPNLAATYELEGGIYYLQKKYKDALDAYTLASNFNPKNPQVVRMRNYLETSLGVRKREINEPEASDPVAAGSSLPETPPVSETQIQTTPPTADNPTVPPQAGGQP